MRFSIVFAMIESTKSFVIMQSDKIRKTMQQLYGGFYTNTFCTLMIINDNESLREMRFLNQSEIIMPQTLQCNDITKRVCENLDNYFNQSRKFFHIPLKPQGTPFCQKVWHELQRIPYGQTRTYKQIAQNIHHAKAYRAVGNANNKNPIPIFIPCHRVIATNGQLSGYAYGVELKAKLLDLESRE